MNSKIFVQRSFVNFRFPSIIAWIYPLPSKSGILEGLFWTIPDPKNVMSLCWWLESGVGGRPHVYSSPSRRSAEVKRVESPKLPDDLPAEVRLEVEAWGKKNSHKAKLGFLVKCIYRMYIYMYIHIYIYICIYLFGRWCLGDVLLLHFLTGPHFWVPSCWSRFWGIYHDQIQYPSQNHWWDVHFWHIWDLWPLVSRTLKTRQNQCFTRCFCCMRTPRK